MNQFKRYDSYIIFAMALLVRLVSLLFINVTFDDAFLTFRVARNLAHGIGFCFNPGEILYATTTVLYTYFLIPGELLGIGIPFWSEIINILSASLTAALIYSILKGKVRPGLAWLAALVMVISPVDVLLNLTGMESPTVYLLILASTWFYVKDRGWWLGIVLGLIFLDRPEGILAAFVFIAGVLIFKRHLFWQAFLPLLVLAGSWFLYAQITFGTIIPHTFLAKQAFFMAFPTSSMNHIIFFINFFLMALPLAPLAILLIGFGIWHCLLHRREFLPLVVWSVGIYFGHFLSYAHINYWYLCIALPGLFICAAVGLEQVLARFLPKLGRIMRKRSVVLVVALLMIVNTVLIVVLIIPRVTNWKQYTDDLFKIGDWFVQQRIPKDKVLGIEAIGIVGWVTDMRILDVYGLTSPSVVKMMKDGRHSDENIMNELKPDYYLSHKLIPEQEVPDYQVIKIFDKKGLDRTGLEAKDYVYSRKD